MFFDVFKVLCEKKGVSCKRATEDMGLSNSIATKWKKTGAMPQGDTLNKIAAYFGVSADYLLGADETGHYDERGIENTDIRMIARAGRKMSPEQAENLRKYAQYMFPEAFADDDP